MPPPTNTSLGRGGEEEEKLTTIVTIRTQVHPTQLTLPDKAHTVMASITMPEIHVCTVVFEHTPLMAGTFTAFVREDPRADATAHCCGCWCGWLVGWERRGAGCVDGWL